MFRCTKCSRNFESKSRLVQHTSRARPCRPPTHFCVMCKKGLASYRTLWEHKKYCINRPGCAVENEERVRSMKKKLLEFFRMCHKDDFLDKLNALEALFPDPVDVLETL